MICPNCSKDVSETNKFCPECGSQLEATTDSTIADSGEAIATTQSTIQPSSNQYGKVGFATKYDGLSIAGMVLGILAVVIFLWAPVALIVGAAGIVLSAIGMNRVRRSEGVLSGYGLAIAGLATSIVAVVLAAIVFMIFIG